MPYLVIFLLVAADRALKVFLPALLADGRRVTLIPGVLGLELLEGGNTGAAFGLLGGKTALLTAVSLLVSAFLLWALWFRRFSSPLAKWAFVLVCAGALGNLYDRLFLGAVTDYFVFLFMDFPVFNLADCLVDIGAALYFIYAVFLQKDEPLFVKREAPPAERSDG